MNFDLSNDEAIALARRESALRAEREQLEREVQERRERLRELEDEIEIAESVNEVYKGVALETRGGRVECVSRPYTTRYAEVVKGYKVDQGEPNAWGLRYGEEACGRQGEKTYGCWYPRSAVELAAREWVVAGVPPDLDGHSGA